MRGKLDCLNAVRNTLTMFEITRLRLPIELNALPANVSAGWIPDIVGLPDRELVDLLRKRWSSFQVPYLRNLSAAILDREFQCLSIDSEGKQWLSFGGERTALHVAPPAEIPAELKSNFPFPQIPGLADFVRNFGGLANWSLPPCPWFIPADKCRVVASDCECYSWGLVGDWAGSLPLYNTGTGNFIVVSPADRCAKWEHDIGWEQENEDPFETLPWSMSDLIEEFIAYLSLNDEEAKESPFYY
jgi:hypothetical protein